MRRINPKKNKVQLMNKKVQGAKKIKVQLKMEIRFIL